MLRSLLDNGTSQLRPGWVCALAADCGIGISLPLSPLAAFACQACGWSVWLCFGDKVSKRQQPARARTNGPCNPHQRKPNIRVPQQVPHSQKFNQSDTQRVFHGRFLHGPKSLGSNSSSVSRRYGPRGSSGSSQGQHPRTPALPARPALIADAIYPSAVQNPGAAKCVVKQDGTRTPEAEIDFQ